MGTEKWRGPMGVSREETTRELGEEVKERFVRAKGWYVPSLHDKYLRTEEGL